MSVELPHTAGVVMAKLRQLVPDMPEGANTTVELVYHEDQSCLVRVQAWGVTRQRRVNPQDMRGFTSGHGLRDMLAQKAKDLYRAIPDGGRFQTFCDPLEYGRSVQVTWDTGRPEVRRRRKKKAPEPEAPRPLRTRRAMKFGGPR